MTALLAFSAIGIIVALLRGGSLAGWTHARIEWWSVALASLVVQLILHNSPIDRQPWAVAAGPVVWIACLAVTAAVLVRNASLQPATRGAWAVAAAGVGLNLLVVVANGGVMPQSADARSVARGVRAAPLEADSGRLRNVVAMSSDTRLNVLGDVIPEPAWLPRSNVISIGDVLLGCGLGWWALSTTLARRRAGGGLA